MWQNLQLIKDQITFARLCMWFFFRAQDPSVYCLWVKQLYKMLDMISLVKCPCEYIDPVLLVDPHLGHENLGQVQSTEHDQFSTRGKLHQSDRPRDSRCSDMIWKISDDFIQSAQDSWRDSYTAFKSCEIITDKFVSPNDVRSSDILSDFIISW